MMTYELPRTESGEVDWGSIAESVCDYPDEWATAKEFFKAIDANARAEQQAKIMRLMTHMKTPERQVMSCYQAEANDVTNRHIEAIRNMGDSE